MYRRPAIERADGSDGTDGTVYANLSASGSLWKDALIMRDDVSHSMWSQLEGWAVRGPEEGRKLETYPFERMTYRAWKERHPDTLVLEKDAREVRTESVYASYFTSKDRMGIFGSRNPDERLRGKDLVLGVQAPTDRVAVPLDALKRARHVSFALGNQQVICIYDAGDGAVRSFRAPGDVPFVYLETGGGDAPGPLIGRGDARWDLGGRSLVEGGQSLARADATPVFWFAWAEAYPETRIESP